MKIQNKIILIVSTSIIVFGVIALTLQYMYLQPEFERISTEMAQKDMVKAMNILTTELNNMANLAQDYAAWDQSYTFVEGENTQYVKEHIADDAMSEVGLSLILFYNMDNKLYYGRQLNTNQEWTNIDPVPLKAFEAKLTAISNASQELVLINQKLYLIAIEPIIHTDRTGPANGKLIFGKSIDAVFTPPLLKSLELDLQLYTSQNDSAQNIEVASKLFKNKPVSMIFGEAQGTPYALESTNANTMTGYSLYKDILGTPVLLLKTVTEKTITIIGIKFGYFSALSIFCCGLIIALLLIFFFRRVIVKPLKALTAMVGSFNLKDTTEEDHSTLIQRSDEIGQLAKSIQSMSHLVVEKHSEVLQLNSDLDAKVMERTQALKFANDSLQLADNILNETSESIIIVDAQMKIIRVNDALLRLTHYRRDELIGQAPTMFRSDHHDPKFYQQIWQKVHSNAHWSGEYWTKRKDNSFYPTLLTINVIKNDKNQITHYVGLASDITYIKETEHTLERLAYFDALTELPNRELFHDRLNHAIKRTVRSNELTALLFIDLDRFKSINDTLGHATGDEVLIEVAKRLKTRIRESDTVSRIGGDEFTVILENISNAENAKHIADDMIGLISSPIATSDRPVTVSASIGIALVPNDDVTLEGLMRKADAAMYIAKENGRSRICFSSKEIEQRNQEYLETEAKLRIAVSENDFQLYLQPKVKMVSGNYVIAGAEALIRWITPEGKMISPELFIGIAEETGLIHPIGKWVLEEACRHHKTLMNEGFSLPISVNLSVKQLERDDILEEIKTILQEHNIVPHMIEFELTENMFLKDFRSAISKLEEIKVMGSEIAIDDFGKGYSSMSYIGTLPIDCLKIDKAFIDPIGIPNEKELVSAFIAIAKTHAFKTVAEGVETELQRDYLMHLGCDQLQGYLFSKPLPFNEFLSYVANFN